MHLIKYITSLSFFLLYGGFTQAQLLINEICASNSSTIEDQYGDTPDWIELYNASENMIQLAEYYLSDDPDDLQKWLFPNGIIEVEGRLLLFASAKDETGTILHTNFKLSASGESVILSKAGGVIIDRLDFPALNTDQSMGRRQDGSPEWVIFDTPTPHFSNALSEGTGFTPSPLWGTIGHFFDSPINVSLEHSDEEVRVFFTRDGQLPTTDDEEYSQPIQIDTTTAIRAIAVLEGQIPSIVISRTFFINTQHTLPVLSIMGEPDDLWSWERGILVDGGPNAEEEWPYWGANFWSEVEIPVQLEYFTDEGNLAIAWRADMQTHGGRGARTNPMKSLRLLTKKKYGSRTIDYPFFENREQTQFKRLVLRNASGDYNNAHCRDAFLARYFIDSELDLDVLAHQPIVVYVNGVYYGVENLREKSDEYYLRYNYDVDINQLDFLEEDTFVIKGDFVIFDSMYQYVVSNDLSIQSNFDRAATYFDYKNIGEGFTVQSALNNGDWLFNNIKYWRERKEDARWRYLIFDLDNAMGRYGWSDVDINTFGGFMEGHDGMNRHANIFKAFLANDTYRFYFINRYADLLNTIFRPSVFRLEVDRTLAELEPEMPKHFSRWTWPGFDIWKNDRTAKLYEYLEERPPYARDQLRDYFSLPNEVNLKLNTYPEGAGMIKINTITPSELPWDGVYFNGVPVSLTITPSQGYTFDHWQSTHSIITPDTETSIHYNFEQDDEVVAYFVKEKSPLLLDIYRVSSQELQVRFGLDKAQKVLFSIYDIQGRLLNDYQEKLYGGGQQQTYLPLPDLSAGMYVLKATIGREEVSAKFLIFN